MFKSRKHTILLLWAFVALLALAGCGDDNPADPGGGGNGGTGGTGDAFDQTTAVSQAQVAGPQGVSLVESMNSLAVGVNKAEGSYTYNATEQRWEYHYVYDLSGYDYDWFMTVQYLDSSGTPQMEATGAATARHAMTGTAGYALDQGGISLDYSYVYQYDVTLSGLGTSTTVMTGTGGFDLDYTYSGNGLNQSSSYVLSWETVGDGVSYPASGCPTGTIRYDMDPYHMDLVFDGSSGATSTLYDGSGGAVAGGGSTYPLSCTTK